MTDFHSIRMRDDHDDYWNERAALVAREAMRRSAGGGSAIAQSRATWIAAALLFAAGLTMMIVSTEEHTPASVAELRLAVAPADDVGRALTLPERPPAIEALLSEPAVGTRR